MNKLFTMILMCCLVTSCATQTFRMGNNSSGNLRKETMQHFFIQGIGQDSVLNPVAYCGSLNRVAKVEVKQTFLDGFLEVLTWGIYTPRSAYIYCK